MAVFTMGSLSNQTRSGVANVAKSLVEDMVSRKLRESSREALPKNPIMGQAITDFYEVGELQRTYNFEVIMPALGGYTGIEISKFCQGITFGDYDMQEVESLRYGSRKSSHAGHLDVDDVTIRFVVPYPDKVSDYLFSWRNKVISIQGYYKMKAEYAKTVYVRTYSTEGKLNSLYILKNMFPLQTPTFELDYADEDMIVYSIRFSVDKIDVV